MKYRLPASFLAFLLTSLLVVPAGHTYGPWTNSSGEYFIQLGETLYQASEYRDGTGEISDQGDYRSLTTFTYGEVGIWDETQLQFYLPFVAGRVEQGETSHSEYGFGDANIGLQTSPLDLDVPTSFRFEAKLPLYGRPANPLAPAPGDHQIDLSLRASVGGGLHHIDVPMYFYVDAGYMHRTNWNFDAQIPGKTFSDAFVAQAEAGYDFDGLFTVSMTSVATLPFDRQPQRDEAYITVGPSVYLPVTDRFGVDVDGYYTPYSRNAGAGWALTAGVFVTGGGE